MGDQPKYEKVALGDMRHATQEERREAEKRFRRAVADCVGYHEDGSPYREGIAVGKVARNRRVPEERLRLEVERILAGGKAGGA